MKCPYCSCDAKLVTGEVIYPHRQDLSDLNFWSCADCDAYVGTHKANTGYGDGTRPLGRLANRELRAAKSEAHKFFDPIWKSGKMTRKQAYQWLAEKMNLTLDECHIGMFDVDQCKDVIRNVLVGRTGS